MTDSIDERVYALVAEEQGVRREKLVASTTLSHDLGMEGDDAVEFFEQFSQKFAVDLTRLHEDWHCYFGPEGVSVGGMLFVLVPTLGLALVLQHMIPKFSFWVYTVIAFVAWMGAVYFWQKRHPDRYPQIRIQDLIDAVRAGSWTRELPMGVKARSGNRREYGGVYRWFTR
jgi:Protein of unknown function (DUF1493)